MTRPDAPVRGHTPSVVTLERRDAGQVETLVTVATTGVRDRRAAHVPTAACAQTVCQPRPARIYWIKHTKLVSALQRVYYALQFRPADAQLESESGNYSRSVDISTLRRPRFLSVTQLIVSVTPPSSIGPLLRPFIKFSGSTTKLGFDSQNLKFSNELAYRY
ncbi:hypothetical protein J6590_050118 [Homalodisca vitripennis]|nr:hypothetical protein J6590_050118 [Homalodisca vitripennis]